jgi:hypothetical protein
MKCILHKLTKDGFSIYPKIIILQITLALLTLPGIVLCMGTDGHFALENASKSFKCEDIAESTHYGRSQTSPLTRIYSDKGHCGPCRDIVISIDSSAKSRLKAQELSSEINAKVFSPLSIPLPALIEISTENQFPQTPPRVDPKITSLQTVILLC